MTTTPTLARPLDLDQLVLKHGSHKATQDAMCVQTSAQRLIDRMIEVTA